MSENSLARAKALLRRLIAFESVSDRSNLPLIAFVEDYLASLGVASRRAPNGSKDKTALLATVGPWVDGGVVLWATPTSCRSPDRRGRARRSSCARRTAAFMAKAPAI